MALFDNYIFRAILIVLFWVAYLSLVKFVFKNRDAKHPEQKTSCHHHDSQE